MKECSYIYVCVVIKSGSESRTSNTFRSQAPELISHGFVSEEVELIEG
jgi:hypothetical protein